MNYHLEKAKERQRQALEVETEMTKTVTAVARTDALIAIATSWKGAVTRCGPI